MGIDASRNRSGGAKAHLIGIRTEGMGEVARRLSGVAVAKVKLLALGAGTDGFHPAETDDERETRAIVGDRCGYSADDIVCVYTECFTRDKNPLVPAKAIDVLAEKGPRYKGLFIGDGTQRAEIGACPNTTMAPFMAQAKLALHCRAAEIGVWPRQEAMSMIDTAAIGVPIVVSNRIGQPGGVTGNGKMCKENDVDSLVAVIRSFASADEWRAYGAVGRRKMLEGFRWNFFARTVDADFVACIGRQGAQS